LLYLSFGGCNARLIKGLMLFFAMNTTLDAFLVKFLIAATNSVSTTSEKEYASIA